MNMSLSKSDIKAIKGVVESTIEEKVDPKFENLEIQIANGLVDVESRLRKDIRGSEAKLSRQIKNLTIRQEETLGLVLQHETRISQLEPAPAK